jgi:hypothetical protein
MKIAERIKDCDEDEDEEFTGEDRQRCKNEIEADKQAYLHGFQNILTINYHPNITFTPILKQNVIFLGNPFYNLQDNIEQLLYHFLNLVPHIPHWVLLNQLLFQSIFAHELHQQAVYFFVYLLL